MPLLFLAVYLFCRTGVSSMRPSKNDLNGVHLTLATYHIPPFDLLVLEPDGNYSYSGSSPLTQEWLAARLSFTEATVSRLVSSVSSLTRSMSMKSYIFLDNTTTKSFASTTDHALLLLANKEIDAIATGLVATPERKKNMDFAYLLWGEPYVMIVPQPGEEPRLFAIIKPFQPLVWLLILVSGFVTVSSLSIFSWFYSSSVMNTIAEIVPNAKRRDISMFSYISAYTMYIVNIMTNQGLPIMYPIDRLSFRLLVVGWLLIAMVLVNSYSSTIISYLSVAKMRPSINTFEDIVKSQDVGIILRKDYVIGKQILEATSGVLKAVGDQARQNPDRLFTDMEKLNAKLDTERFAYPFVKAYCKFFVANKFKEDGKCRFRITDPLPVFGEWSLALQKNSKYTQAINDALIELWESGLPPLWVKNHIPQAPQCFAKIKPRTRQVAIRLIDLLGAFSIFSLGISLAAIAFVSELVVRCAFKFRHMPNTVTILVIPAHHEHG